MTLSLSNRRDGGSVTVVASGEIEFSTAEQLRRAIADLLTDADVTTVLLDLAQVTFIDSAGINALLIARRSADEHGREFRVGNPDGLVRDLLQMTGVSAHLEGNVG